MNKVNKEKCGDPLNEVDASCHASSPHTRQNIGAHQRKHYLSPNNLPTDLTYGRTKDLCHGPPENIAISVLHIGQRKLLLVEIYFLTKHLSIKDSKTIVIYAGAGRPGLHNALLYIMFPQVVEWIFIDPVITINNKTYKLLKKLGSNIKMRSEYMTNEIAAELAQYAKNKSCNILFMSDIRGIDEGDDMPSNRSIRDDMKMQAEWHNIIQAEYSMLKFRLPWPSSPSNKSETNYLSGEILIQPWATLKSTETRLIVKKNAIMQNYNNRDYESQMFWHNRRGRPSCYPVPYNIPIKHENGLDYCWDCTSEILILHDYIAKYIDATTNAANLINTIVTFITNHISPESPLNSQFTMSEQMERGQKHRMKMKQLRR
jgi:hypothetical protein